MKILYYSVHQILEDDEVRLLKKLGHSVCCLGSNGPNGPAELFREPIVFSAEELALYDAMEETGCVYNFISKHCVLTAPFVDLFDIVIVMHDTDFILRHWQILRRRPVIWRTIGQGVDAYEERLRECRRQGLGIVRYSPVEQTIPRSLGEDAVIRFCKDPEAYNGWTGAGGHLLTFSNHFLQRYPDDARDYLTIVEDLPSALGGQGNDAFPNAIGMLSDADQKQAYRSAGAYLYASGLTIPYTLNFMEAWMTGVPVIVHAPPDRQGRYFEIASLIEHGVSGFIAMTPGDARSIAMTLLADKALAGVVGERGRRRAIELFSTTSIGAQWQDVLTRFAAAWTGDRTPAVISRKAVDTHEEIRMPSVMMEIFDTLTQLTPYQIDIPKLRIGNARDGGYVLADMKWDTTVVSFGVGPDVTFEHEMAERGAQIYLNDHTVDATPLNHRRFSFSKVGICGGDTASAPDLAPLKVHLERIGAEHRRGMILKMDVEGHEWDVFSTVAQETLEAFDQIAVEIHWLEHLEDPEYRAKVFRALSNLNKQFTIFHVHANNCAKVCMVAGYAVASVLELSLVRTSLVRREANREVYPSNLDRANHPDFPDISLFYYPFMPMAVPLSIIRMTAENINLQATVKNGI